MAYVRLFWLLGLAVLSPSVIAAQTETCTLTQSWVHRVPFQSSSRELIGTFPFVVEDKLIEDKQLAKLFRHDETGLDISVGIEIVKGMTKKEPYMIRVGLAFSARPDQLFDAFGESSQAVSVYDKHWRVLSVNRTVSRNDRVYTFAFTCERTRRKRSC
jgi:hypothetical protein